MRHYSLVLPAALAIGATSSASVSASNYSDAVLNLNPAAYYQYEDAETYGGAVLTDSSGNERHGWWGTNYEYTPEEGDPIPDVLAPHQVAGAGSQFAGVSGFGGETGKTGDEANLARFFNLGNTNPGGSDPNGGWMNQPSMTYSTFMQVNSGGWWSRIIVNRGRTSSGDPSAYQNDFRLSINSGELYVHAGDHNDPFMGATVYRSNVNIADGDWHHVVATREAAGTFSQPTFGLWINGQEIQLEHVANPNGNLTAMYQWSSDAMLGRRDRFDHNNWGWFGGVLDETAIFQGALSASEIADLYDAAVTGGDDILVGDMNGDGQIDFDDINPFMLALNDPSAYETQYGLDPNVAGDINSDGQLDFDDINPFVALLSGNGSANVVPEPATLSLLALGGLAALARRRRN